MTAEQLIKFLRKFNKDAIVQVNTGDDVFDVDVDEDAPFDENFMNEVSLFLDKLQKIKG